MSLPSKNNKLLLGLTVLFLAGTAFFAYRYYSLVNAGITPTLDKSRCSTCSEYNNVGTIGSKLDINTLKTLAYNYQNPLPGNETHSVWFNLETLKRFIYDIEAKSCSCSGTLGLRMYYGRYPSSIPGPFTADLSSVPNNYGNIHTLFMVPTIDRNVSGTFYHFDFDPASSTTCSVYEGKNFIPMAGDTAGVPTYTLAPFGTSVTALMAQNHGDACPPPPAGAQTCPEVGAFFNK